MTNQVWQLLLYDTSHMFSQWSMHRTKKEETHTVNGNNLVILKELTSQLSSKKDKSALQSEDIITRRYKELEMCSIFFSMF